MKRFLGVLLLMLLFFASLSALASDEEKPKLQGAYEGEVTKIIDGDTFEINGHIFHLLGVDVPRFSLSFPWKKECHATEAKDFLDQKIMGRIVTYDYERMQGRKDKRGEKFVYLYIDGELVNAAIIKQGHGFADRSKDFAKKDEFLSIEDFAEHRNIGMWHLCPIDCTNDKLCRTRNW